MTMHKSWMSAAAIVALSLTMTACSSNDNDNNNDDDKVASLRAATSTSHAAIASTCGATGGIAIFTGFDTNGNGLLDSAEYESQTPNVVCNGTNGSNGSNGTNGTLIKTESLAANNDACPAGGLKLSLGQDANSNGALDSTEVTSVENICSADMNNAAGEPKATKLDFVEISVPTTDEAKVQTHASDKATNLTNGVENNIGFKKLMATAHKDNGEIFGRSKDFEGTPLSFTDGEPYICNGTNSGSGSGQDYTSILQKNDKLFVVSQFECAVGSMYMFEIEQDSTTGELTPKSNTLRYIDQSSEFGGFVHCAGQTTPWNSHLASEEYERDAKAIEEDLNTTTGLAGNGYYDEVTTFYWKGDHTKNNPYYYGWTPEVTIDSSNNPVYTKHYSMGRFSHELSYVMPDKRTVYASDDGSNVGLFMYVADTAEDLSAGTLYAAKWIQKSAPETEGGKADIKWINLGHATNAEIRAVVAIKPNFSDIFNAVEAAEDGTCQAGYTAANTSAGLECLQLKDINGDSVIDTKDEVIASRLETRRFAAMKGATTEFRKEEGITYDPDHGRLYIAMSQISKGMENFKKYGSDYSSYDKGSNNDIQVKYNKCGGIYALDVVPANEQAKDMANGNINSQYVVNTMNAILVGHPTNYPDNSPYAGNSCSVEGIASPDNISYASGTNTLFIGEDTGYHINNYVWAYDVESGALKRTFATPKKAETTSTFWRELNGFSYMTVVAQHPMKDSDKANYLPEEESFVGYVGPFTNVPK